MYPSPLQAIKMPIYTYQSAIEAMKVNSAIEAIMYKMEEMPHETLYWSVERAASGFLHHKCIAENKATKETEEVADSLILESGLCPCLPAPSSPLIRQVASGYLSPKPPNISIPESPFNSPASGALAPLPSPLSPLALSRQTSSSLEENYTGVRENTHIFFDEDGNEIPKKGEFHISIKDYKGNTLSMSHPRILLAYLRFIATYNEDAKTKLAWPVLTVGQRKVLCEFLSVHPPPPEFEADIADLLYFVALCPSE